jgi:hypothetical protein
MSPAVVRLIRVREGKTGGIAAVISRIERGACSQEETHELSA